MPLLCQIQLHKNRVFYRAVIVAGDLVESKAPVEGDRMLQKGQRIQKHVGVADLPRAFHQFFDELPAQVSSAKRGTHEEALHLAVLFRQLSEGNASGGLSAAVCQIGRAHI